MNLRDDERLVFMHLRKSGGTTLHDFLVKQFEEKDVCPHRFNELDRMSQEELARYRFISAHLTWDRVELIPEPKRAFTFLRSPLPRWLSHYRFWIAHKDDYIREENHEPLRWTKDRTLDAFFDELPNAPFACLHELDNHLTRAFLGAKGFELKGPLVESDEADAFVDEALSNMEKLFFVGFVEQFDESLVRLCAALDISYPGSLKPLNTFESFGSNRFTDHIEKIQLTEEQSRRLEPYLRLDEELYRRARAGYFSL